MLKVLILALLSATSTIAQEDIEKECPGFWDISLFSARGYIGKKYLECNNINKKGCRYYLTEAPDRQKTGSGCVYKQEPPIPDVLFYDYTCKDKRQLNRFKHEMINRYNLTCHKIKEDIFGQN